MGRVVLSWKAVVGESRAERAPLSSRSRKRSTGRMMMTRRQHSASQALEPFARQLLMVEAVEVVCVPGLQSGLKGLRRCHAPGAVWALLAHYLPDDPTRSLALARPAC